MSKREKVLHIVEELEATYSNLIAYAYKEIKPSGKTLWWVCIDDYAIYKSKEFEERVKTIREKISFSIVFCYCAPIETELIRLSEENNLILNVKNI